MSNTYTVYEYWPETTDLLHGPMYYKIGVTCVYDDHVFYTLVLWHDNLIHLFHNTTDNKFTSALSINAPMH